MARLRNLLLSEARKEKTDYLVMFDCDLVGPISRDGLVHSVYKMDHDDYAMISANGLVNVTGLHVNLLHLGWIYYDPFAFTYMNGENMNKVRLGISRKRGEKIIPVRSAFSGAALYDMKKLKGIDYIEQKKICEHKTLNFQLHIKGYKLGMNPSFILLAGIQGDGCHR